MNGADERSLTKFLKILNFKKLSWKFQGEKIEEGIILALEKIQTMAAVQ